MPFSDARTHICHTTQCFAAASFPLEGITVDAVERLALLDLAREEALAARQRVQRMPTGPAHEEPHAARQGAQHTPAGASREEAHAASRALQLPGQRPQAHRPPTLLRPARPPRALSAAAAAQLLLSPEVQEVLLPRSSCAGHGCSE